MNKLILFFLIICSSNSFSQERIPSKTFSKANKIYDLINANKIDKAIQYTLEVNKNGRKLWLNQMHGNYSQGVSRNTKSFHLYFSELQRLEDQKEIKELSYPIYLWSQSFIKNDLSSDDILAAYPEALKQSSFNAKTETYIILALKNLAGQDLITQEELITGVKACIDNLKPKIVENSFYEKKEQAKSNSWRRFVLSYAYFLLSEEEPEQKSKHLKNAFEYSPDVVDFNHYINFYFRLLFAELVISV